MESTVPSRPTATTPKGAWRRKLQAASSASRPGGTGSVPAWSTLLVLMGGARDSASKRRDRAPVIFLPVTFRPGQADSGVAGVSGLRPGQAAQDQVAQHPPDFGAIVIAVPD